MAWSHDKVFDWRHLVLAQLDSNKMPECTPETPSWLVLSCLSMLESMSKGRRPNAIGSVACRITPPHSADGGCLSKRHRLKSGEGFLEGQRRRWSVWAGWWHGSCMGFSNLDGRYSLAGRDGSRHGRARRGASCRRSLDCSSAEGRGRL